MRYSTEMQRRQKTSNEGWPAKAGVEPRSMQGAPSISAASKKGRNDGSEYAGNLLEKILDRNNLNNAFKRVKSNRGSHGVDGMKVDELLPFLKQNGVKGRLATRQPLCFLTPDSAFLTLDDSSSEKEESYKNKEEKEEEEREVKRSRNASTYASTSA